MSGWRLGFAVASAEVAEVIGKMINTTLSCTPPMVQLAGTAALKSDKKERDEVMLKFREKVVLLTEGLNRIPGFRALDPAATFYVFPNVARVCNELEITSHGLALFMLQGADDHFGIACLGGECFGRAGAGFLRLSCAEPNSRLQQALEFIPKAISRTDRLAAWLGKNPQYRLEKPYATD
jgi:aspartate aminotransferase